VEVQTIYKDLLSKDQPLR